MTKEEQIVAIEKGENVTTTTGNATINNVISVAEKVEEKKEPETEVAVEENSVPEESEKTPEEEPVPTEVAEAPAEEPTQPEIPVEIPVAVQEETPQIPFAPIDFSGINIPESGDSTIYPSISSEQPDVNSISFGNSVENNDVPAYDTNSEFNQNYNTPMFGGFAETQNKDFNNFENLNNLNNDFNGNLDESVFKTANDVDASFERIMADVRKSYEENISGPTKTLVEFVNEFIKWGNEVTANGLNRSLFDRYDELIALLKKQKTYENVETRNSEYTSSSMFNFGDDQVNNVRDDQINNGGMGIAA